MSDIFSTCSANGCPLAIVCERKHYKGALEVAAYNFLPIGADECSYYMPRAALTCEKAIFRPGGPRHNRHAPHEKKPRAPDLMVKRHIRNGRNVSDG